jgi:hypothetical protein
MIKQHRAHPITSSRFLFQNFSPYVKGHKAANKKQTLNTCRWKYPYTYCQPCPEKEKNVEGEGGCGGKRIEGSGEGGTKDSKIPIYNRD